MERDGGDPGHGRGIAAAAAVASTNPWVNATFAA
jgi:hypothetical protein